MRELIDIQGIPLTARWALYALGSVGGSRVSSPLDQVAAWMLRNHPELTPLTNAESLGGIRTRTHFLDAWIFEVAERARVRGEKLDYWSIGSGFDARWYRQLPHLEDVVARYVEVESSEVLTIKDKLLKTSPFEAAWSQVVMREAELEVWAAEGRAGARPLVVAEGLTERLDMEEIEGLLARLRVLAPDAIVLLDAPVQRGLWTRHLVHRLGWRVTAEQHLRASATLISRDGREICPGIHPVRLQCLEAR